MSIFCYLTTVLNCSKFRKPSSLESTPFKPFSNNRNPFDPFEPNLFFILIIIISTSLTWGVVIDFISDLCEAIDFFSLNYEFPWELPNFLTYISDAYYSCLSFLKSPVIRESSCFECFEDFSYDIYFLWNSLYLDDRLELDLGDGDW